MSEHFEYLAEGGDPELVVARARLARRQAELLSALVAGGPVPEGFDREQVRIQAQGLLAKRRDTVARVAPEVPRILGAQYRPLFRRYARQGPAVGGYRADARAFAEWAVDWAAVGAPDTPWRPALERWLRPAEPPRRRWRRFHG
ncbi:hypothetical protein [Saccharothrix sp. ST-888]|uniref:hypothetical protein n=1 Tax=Saccharothrix sp. ST-888 TaxID=1427391 RepID=UPI0005ECAACB|nr:hypothetical protein [Saccharothrix sp. ST-888]KJK59063.1 hypothetical protein UK12_06630 [Saccharothrix sp. ST-888]